MKSLLILSRLNWQLILCQLYSTPTVICFKCSKFVFLTEQPSSEKKSFKEQYVAFLIAFGIIGLAIAFVIGQAASKLVTAFVKDIVDPTIGLFLPAGSLENMTSSVIGIHGVSSEFKYGDLISNIIDFLIIGLIVFIAYKMLSKYKLVEDKTKPEEKK
jgi:large conductance mechanosensitive channel